MRARFIFLSAILISGFVSFIAPAQYVSDGSILHVDENTVLSTSYPLSSEGFISNEGIIIALSDWKSAGIYQGAGEIRLNGTTLQEFAQDNQPVQIFTVENPAGVNLSGTLPISGILRLNEGIIRTAATDTLLILDNATIDGGSPASYVEGPLHREGRGLRFFPVGNSGTYLPVILSDVTGGDVTIVMEARQNFSGSLPANISRISREYFWRQSHYNGTYTGSAVVLPMYDDQLERSSTVLLGFESDYTIYDDIIFSNGAYYDEAATTEPVSQSVLLLATADQMIRDENVLYVPNALAPGAPDPENRVIKVYGDLLEDDFEFVVYDRRGIEVFSTSDLERMQRDGWNGNSVRTGEILPQGSYVYALKAFNRNNESVERTGTITILK